MIHLAIVTNEWRDPGLQETRRVLQKIFEYRVKVYFDEKFANLFTDIKGEICFASQKEMLEQAEMLLVLGGDGTILGIAPVAAEYQIPIVGINFGHLGFLAQAEKGDHSIFDDLFSGKYETTKCMMLNGEIIKNGVQIEKFLALNDIVLSGSGDLRMIHTAVDVEDTHIGSYFADGIIVATAVGSTAYSLSAGGAVMHPDVDAMMITPICPHTLKARSMVIPGKDRIELKALPPYRTETNIYIDGKKKHILADGELVRITKSKYYTSLIQLEYRNFFDVLREKLSD